MSKEAKNVITREFCYKELRWLTKADLFSELILLAVVSVICIPFIVLSFAFLMKYIPIISWIIIFVFAVPPSYFVYRLFCNVGRKKLVEDGKFSVLCDSVARLSRGESVRGGRATANVVYFSRYGRYVPDRTVFEMTSVGDEFYIVVLHTSKEEMCFAYPKATYEYK